MTSNHLLLFHLAELMLKQEQHILPVDILFDDAHIGDFVKSIQIDSPYQQLLLEGVITESVRNEKLYVSFTVEGYFHYVLGEVIEKKLVGKNSIQFSDLLKSNQLTGLLEGIENALIREVENGQTQLLYELIDSGGDILNACITPLAHLFLINIGYDYSKPDFEVIKKHIASIVNILFSKFSDHDIAILQLTIVKLEEIQKYELVSIIYEFIFNSIKPSTINQAILLTKAIPYIDAQQRVSKLKFLSELNIKKKSFDYFLFLFELASQYQNIAFYDEAIEFNKKAICIINDIGNQYLNYLPIINSQIGTIYIEKGEYSLAIEFLQSAYDQLEANSETDTSLLISVANNLGVVCKEIGDFDKALDYYNIVLENELKIHGKFHFETATVYNNLGLIFKIKGNFQEALNCYSTSFNILAKTFGELHSNTGAAYNNLAALYFAQNDFKLAIVNYKKSIKVIRRNLDNKHPLLAAAYNNIGMVYKALKNYPFAIKYYSLSLDIFEYKLGDEHQNTNLTRFNLANCFIKSEQYNDAIDILLKAYKFYKSDVFPNSLALCYEKKKLYAESLSYYIEAANLKRDRFGIYSKETLSLVESCIRLASLCEENIILPLWIRQYNK